MSNKTKHTPGPWWNESGIIHAKHPELWQPNNHAAEHVCRITSDREEADALLIAAAPDMLEALKEARMLIEHWGMGANEYFQKKYDLAGDLAMLDSIIAKAENDKTFAVTKD